MGLLPLLPPRPSVVGWATTFEPSWLLPDEPSPEDVPDVRELSPRRCECSGSG